MQQLKPYYNLRQLIAFFYLLISLGAASCSSDTAEYSFGVYENVFVLYDTANPTLPQVGDVGFYRFKQSAFLKHVFTPYQQTDTTIADTVWASRFTQKQRALYFLGHYMFVDSADVRNTIMTNRQYYLPPLINACLLVNDTALASQLIEVQELHNELLSRIKLAKEGKISSRFLWRNPAMDTLVSTIGQLKGQSVALLKQFVLNNHTELMTNQNGQAFDLQFTGTATSTYPNGKPKEALEVVNGVLNGAYIRYYVNEATALRYHYNNGQADGLQQYYYRSGVIKSETLIDASQGTKQVKKYHPNGTLQFKYVLYRNGLIDGKWQSYYPNGQLKAHKQFKDGNQTGTTWHYWPNGQQALEVRHNNSGQQSFANAWNYEGTQTLTNGVGKFTRTMVNTHGQVDSAVFMVKNFRYHGKATTYRYDSTVKSIEVYRNGERDGISRYFAANGVLRQRVIYDENRAEETSDYPDLINPKVITEIVLVTPDSLLIDQGLLAEELPQITNTQQVIDSLMPENVYRYACDVGDAYSFATIKVCLNQLGQVQHANVLAKTNLLGSASNKVTAAAKQLLFTKSTGNEQPVDVCLVVEFRFYIEEDMTDKATATDNKALTKSVD